MCSCVTRTCCVGLDDGGRTRRHRDRRAARAARRRRLRRLLAPRSLPHAGHAAATEERQQRRTGVTKLDVDDAVEDEIDGEVDEQEEVGDCYSPRENVGPWVESSLYSYLGDREKGIHRM